LGRLGFIGPLYINPTLYQWEAPQVDEEESEHDDHLHDHSLHIDLVMTEWDDFC
jgi:hypothetical protein